MRYTGVCWLQQLQESRSSRWLLRIYDRVNRFVTDGAYRLAVAAAVPLNERMNKHVENGDGKKRKHEASDCIFFLFYNKSNGSAKY